MCGCWRRASPPGASIVILLPVAVPDDDDGDDAVRAGLVGGPTTGEGASVRPNLRSSRRVSRRKRLIPRSRFNWAILLEARDGYSTTMEGEAPPTTWFETPTPGTLPRDKRYTCHISLLSCRRLARLVTVRCPSLIWAPMGHVPCRTRRNYVYEAPGMHSYPDDIIEVLPRQYGPACGVWTIIT